MRMMTIVMVVLVVTKLTMMVYVVMTMTTDYEGDRDKMIMMTMVIAWGREVLDSHVFFLLSLPFSRSFILPRSRQHDASTVCSFRDVYFPSTGWGRVITCHDPTRINKLVGGHFADLAEDVHKQDLNAQTYVSDLPFGVVICFGCHVLFWGACS